MSAATRSPTDHAAIVRDALDLAYEAHSALDALERELAEWKAENSRLRGQLSEIAHTNAPMIRDLGAHAEAAEADNARLREALTMIAGYNSHNDGTGCRCGHRMSMCNAVMAATYCSGHPAAEIAAHALAAKETP